MTQLGAFPIWDYTINQEKPDIDWLMSCYGAYLSGWLIYNSGGYWSDAPENKGATGWIIQGSTGHLTGQPIPKGFPLMNGLVALSGESELGFFGALRMASSILFRHPVLGVTGLGCDVEQSEGETVIRPRDGLSNRFVDMLDGWRVEADRDQIVKISIQGSKIVLKLRNYTQDEHETKISLISQQQERVIKVHVNQPFETIDILL